MIRLQVKVVPKSSRTRIAGWVGDRLKIQVSAPPERGKANDAVIAALAEALGIPRARIRILSGESSPLKTLEIQSDVGLLTRLPPP